MNVEIYTSESENTVEIYTNCNIFSTSVSVFEGFPVFRKDTKANIERGTFCIIRLHINNLNVVNQTSLSLVMQNLNIAV